MDFKTYGLAIYTDNIDLLKDYYSDEYINFMLSDADDMLLNIIDCDSLSNAKDLLLSESKNWLENIVLNNSNLKYADLVSLLNNDIFEEVIVKDGVVIDMFSLSERQCKITVTDGLTYSRRYKIVEATYYFNTNY